MILFLLFLGSCSGDGGTSRTEIFGGYLKEQFDRSLPAQEHHFLIVSRGCKGAVAKALMALDTATVQDPALTVIASDPEPLRYFPGDRKEVLMDHEGQLDHLALPLYNLSLIHSKDGKIEKIISEKQCSIAIGDRIEKALQKS